MEEYYTLLANSNFCRLCSEENKNGIDIFTADENSDDLCTLINRYLPIQVNDNDVFPRTICPGCHIQLESTKMFMDLIIEGQAKLRSILKEQEQLFIREEKERQKLEQALKNHNPNASVETYSIQTDENGEKYVIQIYSEGPLFSPEHQLTLNAEGFDKLKRKKGRPPKVNMKSAGDLTVKSNEAESQIEVYSERPLFLPEHQLPLNTGSLDKPKRKKGRPPKLNQQSVEDLTGTSKEAEAQVEEPPSVSSSIDTISDDPNQRRRRNIRPPARYAGSVQGSELTRILKKEGVIDEDSDKLDGDVIIRKDNRVFMNQKKGHLSVKTLIGRMVEPDGDFQSEKRVFMKSKPGIVRFERKGPQQKFICDICKKEFQHYGRWQTHKRSHKIQYCCKGENCGIQSNSREAIATHQKETGHQGISAFEYIYKIDGKVVVPDVESLSSESTTEQAAKDSGLCIEPEASCDDNIIIENDENLLKCMECEKTFSCKQNFEVHMRAIHSRERPFKCKICKKCFAYACSFKKHMLIHNENEENDATIGYPCDTCDKIFNHPSSVIYHKESEHDNRRFICNKCNKMFKHRQLLLRHQLVHTDDRPFKCDECNRQFKTKMNLMNHQIIHKGIKKFICPICGNSFLHKTSLWVHLKWHEGKKPYQCEVCNKSFSQKGNLTEHMRIHTGEKPFACNLCGRNFTTSSQCRLHMKRHTGEKPYGCKFCERRFLHKKTYYSHLRRHLNERPFMCKFCPKAFPDQWACTRHERIHLGVKNYKCDVCDKAFTDCANFTKHKKIHFKNGIQLATLDKKHETCVMEVKQLEENSSETSNEISTSQSKDANNASVDTVIEFLPASESDASDTNTQQMSTLVNPTDFQIQNMALPISIMSQDNVTSNNQKLEGLLPDGTIVCFDVLSKSEDKSEQSLEAAQLSDPEENILKTEIQFLEDNSMSNTSETLNVQKPFISEDGKVCFIATFDANNFLTLN